MQFKQALQEKLKKKLGKKELEMLPAGYQQIGGITLIRLQKGVLGKKKEIGKAVKEVVGRTETVCLNKGVSGQYREPKIEWLCGKKCLETVHTEHGCRFAFNVGKIMWSKGNIAERKRIYSQVKQGETVMDFFAGIGYWSIPIAKHSQVKKVYAFELNPVAVKYLKKNIGLNRIPEGKIEVVLGRCEEKALEVKEKADRVILGLLPNPDFALETAFRVLKEGGIMHYEGIAESAGKLFSHLQEKAQILGHSIILLKGVQVKQYAPKRFHYTLDVRVLNA